MAGAIVDRECQQLTPTNQYLVFLYEVELSATFLANPRTQWPIQDIQLGSAHVHRGSARNRAGGSSRNSTAPELVAFTAFQQYRAARSLNEKMRYHFPIGAKERPGKYRRGSLLRSPREQPSESTQKEIDVEETLQTPAPRLHGRKHKWTMIHSYFAVMGGFAVQISDGEPNFFPSMAGGKDRHVRLSMTPEALVYLEEQLPGIVPDLPKSFIEDKSKGSILAKSIVCFQGESTHDRTAVQI